MPIFVIPVPAIPSVAVDGTAARFPYVGFSAGAQLCRPRPRNGARSLSRAAVFFLKPSDPVVDNGVSGALPTQTRNFHYEIELVVAIGVGVRPFQSTAPSNMVYGYTVGNDLTRRDLQLAAREQGRP